MIDFSDKPLEEFLVWYPSGITNEPSPVEIRRICKEIQATWTPQVRKARRVYQKCPAETIKCEEMHNWVRYNM